MKKTILTIVLISQLVLLASCSTGVSTPDDGQPSMSQAYDAAVMGQTVYTPSVDKHGVSQADMPANNAALPTATVSVGPTVIASTLNSQFPTLPNPQSVMYIFGHYAGDEQLPIPGHFTAFSLYTQNHYALPTEIQRPYNDGQFVGGQ